MLDPVDADNQSDDATRLGEVHATDHQSGSVIATKLREAADLLVAGDVG
jgi:hypothetical protein